MFKDTVVKTSLFLLFPISNVVTLWNSIKLWKLIFVIKIRAYMMCSVRIRTRGRRAVGSTDPLDFGGQKTGFELPTWLSICPTLLGLKTQCLNQKIFCNLLPRLIGIIWYLLGKILFWSHFYLPIRGICVNIHIDKSF